MGGFAELVFDKLECPMKKRGGVMHVCMSGSTNIGECTQPVKLAFALRVVRDCSVDHTGTAHELIQVAVATVTAEGRVTGGDVGAHRYRNVGNADVAEQLGGMKRTLAEQCGQHHIVQGLDGFALALQPETPIVTTREHAAPG
jgi:hypothetical protein